MAKGLLLIFLLVSHLFVSHGAESRQITYVSLIKFRNITIENKCEQTVWPGIQTTSTATNSINTTGFVLKKGEARVIKAPSWEGSFWGRSLCSTSSAGSFSCVTGDCGTGKIGCSNAGAELPATLAVFSLNNDNANGQDLYGVSVIKGYNLPLMVVVPQLPQSDQRCRSVGCVVDLNKTCPSELKVIGSSGKEQPIACMSDSRNARNVTKECPTTLYSQNFKNECPLAQRNALDATYTVSCSHSPIYIITFCPTFTPNTTNNNAADPPYPAQIKNGTLEPPSDSPFPAQIKNGTLESPSQSQPSKEINAGTKQKSSWKLKLILGVAAALSLMIIIIVVAITVRTKHASDGNEKNVEAAIMLKRYSYARFKKMTKSFAHVLGKGGFGTVYRGKLPESGQDVAVKILKESEGNGEE